jgi:hypothetical protein
MLIRLEPTFIDTVRQLKQPFSDVDKEKLSELIELNYDKIRSVISAEEQARERAKPTVIELGNIGVRFFALNLYYNQDEDDIPNSVRDLLPTISPVRVDVMSTPQAPDDPKVRYMKVAQIYDDGSIYSKYVNEATKEDEGLLPMDEK